MAHIIANVNEITSLIEYKHEEDKLAFHIDGVNVHMKNEMVTLNIDGTKKKVKTIKIIQALKDMLDSGEFWLDEIDQIVSDIEADRAELREALEAIKNRNTEVIYGQYV